MSDENGNPVRGEVGHFLYRKDLAKGLKFDKKGIMISQGPPDEGITDINTPGFKGTDIKKTPAGTPDPKGIYTEAVAKGFNKNEQKNLLKAREVSFRARDSEAQLIDKILKSNPDEGEEDLDVAPVDSGVQTTAYSEAQLGDFKAKKLVEILKGFGEKRIPLSEKGRIKKILELQT